MIEVKTRGRSVDLGVPKSSGRRMSDPLSQAKVDVSRNDSFHGTPRSVKNRNKFSLRQTKEEISAAQSCSQSSLDPPMLSTLVPLRVFQRPPAESNHLPKVISHGNSVNKKNVIKLRRPKKHRNSSM